MHERSKADHHVWGLCYPVGAGMASMHVMDSDALAALAKIIGRPNQIAGPRRYHARPDRDAPVG